MSTKNAPVKAAQEKVVAPVVPAKGKTVVPECVQKKSERDSKLLVEKEKVRVARRLKNKERKVEWTQKAQKYEAEYKAVAAKSNADLRESKNHLDQFYVPAEHKLIFATRIRGTKKLHPDVVRTLRLLRLRQLQNGAFIRVNGATMNMLRRVQACVTYGYPSLTTVRKLIYKRGYGKVDGKRIPLTDNRIVEASLGQYGLTCVEDLVHEIYTVGPHFKQANNFLWTFKLSTPKGGYAAKRHPYHTMGDWGNREVYINEWVDKML